MGQILVHSVLVKGLCRGVEVWPQQECGRRGCGSIGVWEEGVW